MHSCHCFTSLINNCKFHDLFRHQSPTRFGIHIAFSAIWSTIRVTKRVIYNYHYKISLFRLLFCIYQIGWGLFPTFFVLKYRSHPAETENIAERSEADSKMPIFFSFGPTNCKCHHRQRRVEKKLHFARHPGSMEVLHTKDSVLWFFETNCKQKGEIQSHFYGCFPIIPKGKFEKCPTCAFNSANKQKVK